MNKVDINCDMGEGLGNEALLMPFIQSCNIACGGHAGKPETMTEVVRLAMENHVKIGAHPSYPDPVNFGRKTMVLSNEKFIQTVQYQINTILDIINDLGGELHHIKAHGALYNDIARDSKAVDLFLKAIYPFRDLAKIFVPFGSVICEKAVEKSFSIVYEAFADRNYNDDLSLVSRQKENALITNSEEIISHVSGMVNENKVTTISGKKVAINAETYCVHSDTKNAPYIVRTLYQYNF